MKYGIIIGSHTNESQSTKVGRYVEQQIKQQLADAETYVLNLQRNPLPLWDESMWGADEGEAKEVWESYSADVASCDAFVVVSPEWSGMVPAGLKNFFLYCSSGELEHKPALIIGLSATRGGTYPVAELRMSSYKNTYLCYIPNHVIIQKVQDVLNGPQADESVKADGYIRARIDHSLKVLEQYACGLQAVRESGVEDREHFPYGM